MTDINLESLEDLDLIRKKLNLEQDTSQWPYVSDLEYDGEALLLKLNISADLKWFEGHFPDNPVLPGVVQVHWAVSLAKKILVKNAAFKQVENLKFKSVVLPGMNLVLSYTGIQAGEKIRFSFSAETSGDIHSEGRLTFE